MTNCCYRVLPSPSREEIPEIAHVSTPASPSSPGDGPPRVGAGDNEGGWGLNVGPLGPSRRAALNRRARRLVALVMMFTVLAAGVLWWQAERSRQQLREQVRSLEGIRAHYEQQIKAMQAQAKQAVEVASAAVASAEANQVEDADYEQAMDMIMQELQDSLSTYDELSSQVSKARS